MSYKTWLARKEHATPFANQAVCRKCKYCSNVRSAWFCSGRGRYRKLTQKEINSSSPCFCPEYIPKDTNLQDNCRNGSF